MNFKALAQAIKIPKIRKELTRRSMAAYMYIYFSAHIEFPFALFHKDFLSICENTKIRYAIVSAFRESAKTTIFTTCFPLWAIMGVQEVKYVVIVAMTKDQAERYLENIKIELETNHLLQKDLGPFRITSKGEQNWTKTDIDLPDYGARITIISQNQGYRGIKYGHHRPDLIICDDLEDVNSVRSEEMRDKMYRKILSDLIPAGHNQKTRYFFVGNLIHEESYLMRLKANLVDKGNNGIFLKIPLLDRNGNSNWHEKFPDSQMDELRRRVGSQNVFNKEYLLIPHADNESIVKDKWIKRYDDLPNRNQAQLLEIAIAIDPAFTIKKTSDYTAIVIGGVYVQDGFYKLYIHKKYVHKKMEPPEILRRMEDVVNIFALPYKVDVRVIVEANGAQELLAHNLRTALQNKDLVYVMSVKNTDDKKARLQAAVCPMERGHVFFPNTRYAKPIRQLKFFHEGTNSDDLVDALSMLINTVHEQYSSYDGQGFQGGVIRI